MKILIAGIGGVGGYFGGLLARKYERSNDVKVCFLARGKHLEEMQKNGLRVIHGKDQFAAHPAIATQNALEIGIADYILVCTKTFDLESTILQLKPCIGRETIIIPLLNGVDSVETIRALLPEASVYHGCAYIVSRLTAPGVIENSGNIQKLFFGTERINEKLLHLEKLMKDAGLEATLTEKILPAIWEKYIFISPTATVTSYFNNSIGQIVESEEKLNFFSNLVEEVSGIARAKGIELDKEIVAKTIMKLKSLPYDATSSMHSDFKSGKTQNESEALTHYVIKCGKELNIPTPTFLIAFEKLKSK